jgi:hypothetical protein
MTGLLFIFNFASHIITSQKNDDLQPIIILTILTSAIKEQFAQG